MCQLNAVQGMAELPVWPAFPMWSPDGPDGRASDQAAVWSVGPMAAVSKPSQSSAQGRFAGSDSLADKVVSLPQVLSAPRPFGQNAGMVDIAGRRSPGQAWSRPAKGGRDAAGDEVCEERNCQRCLSGAGRGSGRSDCGAGLRLTRRGRICPRLAMWSYPEQTIDRGWVMRMRSPTRSRSFSPVG